MLRKLQKKTAIPRTAGILHQTKGKHTKDSKQYENAFGLTTHPMNIPWSRKLAA
jgi:hypothetical protein